jgi:hypothetical protein
MESDPIKVAKNYTQHIKELRSQLGSCIHIDEYIYKKSLVPIPDYVSTSRGEMLTYIHDYFQDIIDKLQLEIDKKYCVAVDTRNESYYI